MSAAKKEASPVELAALLMDAVCTPADNEQTALRELAAHLRVDEQLLQVELMFLRAFSIDFATIIALGESPERTAILDQYYHHWEEIGRQTDEQIIDDLQQHLAYYAQVVAEPGPQGGGSEGLVGQIGQAFARRCQTAEEGQELALLGASMFSALFDEITDLYEGLTIVLLAEEDSADASPLAN
ncbi:MAG: hypothetical protein GKR89_23650 [Candidatus Latescibacteria bacterium]|nr:hypothetical protein [Candidatus Latescibacterota bacterium]